MYATPSETANTNAFCVWPNGTPSQKRDPNEVDLVMRLQAHDEMAFREIVERYASRIYRVCYGILGNRDDANDITQEVFAKVHRSLHRFAGRSSLYAWIYRITVNQCYGFLRKNRFNTTYSGDSLDDVQSPRVEITDWRPTPDRTAMQRDLINNLLSDVAEDDRWLLIAKEVEGFSIAELSQMTGLKENTIKGRLYRVRQALVEASHRIPSLDRRQVVKTHSRRP
ncbi:MAG TPA: RNA polymerase sigma factor [Bryobacteraceae bacterium]|nr:RNA polymerase sigma factor [Bryobacteraceae bacterium]